MAKGDLIEVANRIKVSEITETRLDDMATGGEKCFRKPREKTCTFWDGFHSSVFGNCPAFNERAINARRRVISLLFLPL